MGSQPSKVPPAAAEKLAEQLRAMELRHEHEQQIAEKDYIYIKSTSEGS